MSDNIYKVVEVVGSSSESSDDAVAKAIAEASKRLRKLRWFKVTEAAVTSRTARLPTGR